MDKEFLFGVGITNATQEDILKYILYSLEKSKEKYYIVTPNPEILVYATKNPGFKTILNNARLALCDGMGIVIASKILGKPLKGRTTGVDLMENLCKEVAKLYSKDAKKPITVGFIGGKHGVAAKTAECLRQKYPGLKVVFAAAEWPSSSLRGPTGQQSSKRIATPSARNDKNQLNASIDILFVALGFPKQEEFMAEHVERSEIPVKVMMGVGGAFDYISGQVPRAPESIRKIGLEWLFRLFMQPWRIKRQLALLEFIRIVLKEKILGK